MDSHASDFDDECLDVILYGVNTVIDKSIYKDQLYTMTRRPYYVYASIGCKEMVMKNQATYDYVTIPLNSQFEEDDDLRVLKIEIVQLFYCRKEIGSSNGVTVAGRTQIRLPKGKFGKLRVRVQLVELFGAEVRPNGYVEVEVMRRKKIQVK